MKTYKTPHWTEIVHFLLEHYTQTELSELTGVHQGTISDINRGVLKPRLSYESGAALLKAQSALVESLSEQNNKELEHG